MKLNWFSPLPPASTDIANYSARVLPALAEHAQVTLWSDKPEWDPQLEQWATVRHFTPDNPPWHAMNQADISLYNIGNDRRFHGAIWRIGSALPGIVVLHDYCLHEFFLGVAREELQCRETYLDQMERCYGSVGRGDALDVWEGRCAVSDVVTKYPLTDVASHRALGAIVHTQAAFDAMADGTDAMVLRAELPYPANPQKGARQPPESANGTARNPYRLIVFGFLGRNRCLDKVLDALATFPQRDRFVLDIYGQVYDPAAVEQHIQRLGLNSQVRQYGFVPEEVLENALASADLAINLRFPTMGEASGSQLRIWDHALPSLVTQHGWYESLPAKSVGFVRPGREGADLHYHLAQFLADPRRYIRVGEEGRRHLEQRHAPSGYAKRITEFAKQAVQIRVSHAAQRLAHRAGAELGLWLTPEHSRKSLRHVAEEIHTLLTPTTCTSTFT